MVTQLHTQLLPYSTEQLYDLVVDIEKYPEFLPWCTASRIISTSDNEIIADLCVGYKVFRETFRSRVHLTPKSRIDIEYINGPFNSLNNYWIFKEAPGRGTDIVFFINFQFRNCFFQREIHKFFEAAFNHMVNSFEKRAQALYSPPSPTNKVEDEI